MLVRTLGEHVKRPNLWRENRIIVSFAGLAAEGIHQD
jgi:hypothetical protein